jgi:hypothetical protein
MNKPITTRPEFIQTYENAFERQLNYEERVRYEFAAMRNNEALYGVKFLH